MKFILVVSLVVFAYLLSFNTLGQTPETTHQNLYWARYYNQITINEKWSWHNEIDKRVFFENNRHHHLIMHTHWHYKIAPIAELGFGVTYSRQSPHDPDAISTLVVPEIRPFQEINLTQKLNNKLSLSQRFRIDERFIHKNNSKVLLDGYDFNFRFRYRLQFSLMLGKQTERIKILKLSDELMLSAGKHILYNRFDQNRIYTGFELGINKHFSAELGYLYWFQQRSTGYQFFERNVARLTIYHRINIQKSTH